MKKISIISIFVLFIIYNIFPFFMEIPKLFNNIIYGIITLFAVYFSIFHLDVGRGIKDRFNKNKNDYREKNTKN